MIVNGGGYGVYLAAAQGADVEGNLIGVDATGDNALPNFIGVELDSDSAGNTIRANTISGSSSAGIGVGGAASTIIAGNKIGTNDAGDATIPNIEWGIVDQGTGTTIGGLTTADRNLISGNHDDAGINLLSGSGAQVEGNWIGLAASGTAVLGNLGAGIHVLSGHATIQHNVISGNGRVTGGLRRRRAERHHQLQRHRPAAGRRDRGRQRGSRRRGRQRHRHRDRWRRTPPTAT